MPASRNEVFLHEHDHLGFVQSLYVRRVSIPSGDPAWPSWRSHVFSESLSFSCSKVVLVSPVVLSRSRVIFRKFQLLYFSHSYFRPRCFTPGIIHDCQSQARAALMLVYSQDLRIGEFLCLSLSQWAGFHKSNCRDLIRIIRRPGWSRRAKYTHERGSKASAQRHEKIVFKYWLFWRSPRSRQSGVHQSSQGRLPQVPEDDLQTGARVKNPLRSDAWRESPRQIQVPARPLYPIGLWGRIWRILGWR
jgi:hypothetical protein